jgi:hypothetical protein
VVLHHQVVSALVLGFSADRRRRGSGVLAGGFCHRTKLVTENACPATKLACYFAAAAFSATTWRSKAPLLSTKNTQSEATSQLVVCR